MFQLSFLWLVITSFLFSLSATEASSQYIADKDISSLNLESAEVATESFSGLDLNRGSGFNAENSLSQNGAIFWPGASQGLRSRMLNAFCEANGIANNIPFNQLSEKQRQLIKAGSNDRWYDVLNENGQVHLSFQFHGLAS